MRVNGGSLPDTLRVEEHPQKEGLVIVRLTENVEQTEDGYAYDEYVLVIPGYPGIEADIQANFENWLSQGKAQEEQDKPVEQRLAEANTEIKRLTAENAALVEENAALEDTICELDSSTDERITNNEDSICELDILVNELIDGGNA